jgi:membrane protease YdiL (CAAX protease family)
VDWLEHPLLKWAAPLPMLAVAAPIVWWFFKDTWRELDAEALALRQKEAARGQLDSKPLVALCVAAVVLLLQQYWCKSAFFADAIEPMLRGSAVMSRWLDTYGELAGKSWWAVSRAITYTLPLLAWPLVYKDENALDLGLRVRGLRDHLWLYASFVVLMVPLLFVVAMQPDFGSYYPIYKGAGRSWADFVTWEVVYLAQFFGVEIFFRGWMIRSCRSMGAASIFVMAVPYVMIHFSKPYMEAAGALITGVVLGSLSMRTKSIWSGLLVHATIAVGMDVLALNRRGELPVGFPPVELLLGTVWIASVSIVAWDLYKARIRMAV